MGRQSCRQDIVRVFVDLLEEKPFSHITITELASRARISRTSYYRHFNSQREVLDAYVEELFANLEGQMTPVPSRSLPSSEREDTRTQNIMLTLAYLAEQRHALKTILESDASEVLRTRIMRHSVHVLEDTVIRSQDAPDSPRTPTGRNMMHEFYAAGMCSLICSWICDDCSQDAADLASFLLSAGERLITQPGTAWGV